MSLDQQQELESRYLMHTFARKPVCFVEGSGMHLTDDAGRDYLDFLSGIGVCSLGHCHPAVSQAVAEQAGTLMHVGNYYYISKRGELARLVDEALNAGLEDDKRQQWRSFFTNSGAESNECAMKLARLHARKKAGNAPDAPNVIVTLDGSFHGRTMETLAATAQPAKQEAFQPLPEGFVHTPINDIDALEATFEANSGSICAVMLEPIQGESGVHPCTPEFLEAVERLAREAGALLVFDEVQTGVYRTGRPFAFQHFGIVPDIVSIAKGIGSGMPMGICAAREEVASAFEPGDHGTTFGGSNLAVAAATATLTELGKPGVCERIQQVGEYLRDGLASLAATSNVRGLGLMCACDLDGLDANQVVLDGLACGLVLNATGPRTLRFLPPLVCSTDDVDTLVERLGGLLAG